MIKAMLLYLWQLPQNIAGLALRAMKHAETLGGDVYYIPRRTKISGVSLGSYVIFGRWPDDEDIRHEHGHQKQSLRLGWLYLLVIGLPSLVGNIYDRIAHRRWSAEKRRVWYYSQPWEAWADKLGGVRR